MSDRDVAAIVAYLRSVPAVKNVVPKSDCSKIKLTPTGLAQYNDAQLALFDAYVHGDLDRRGFLRLRADTTAGSTWPPAGPRPSARGSRRC